MCSLHLFLPLYQPKRRCGYMDLNLSTSLCNSCIFWSPPMNPTQVITLPYGLMRSDTDCTVNGVPLSSHKYGEWQPGQWLGQPDIFIARVVSPGNSWKTTCVFIYFNSGYVNILFCFCNTPVRALCCNYESSYWPLRTCLGRFRIQSNPFHSNLRPHRYIRFLQTDQTPGLRDWMIAL